MSGLKLTLITLVFSGLVVGLSVNAHAYSEEIGLSIDKVSPAVKAVAQAYSGIAKSKDEGRWIETKWKEDYVVRKSKILKNIISAKYKRRHKLRIKLTPNLSFTKIEISGFYQQKKPDVAPSIPWQTIKPKLDDLDLERELFFKILKQLEADQKKL